MCVQNGSHLEGSIVEGYIAQECLMYYAGYFHGFETRENRFSRTHEDVDEAYNGLSVFSLKYQALSIKKGIYPDYSLIDQADRYVLVNCNEVQVYAQ